MREKGMNDVQIANWLNDNVNQLQEGISLKMLMFIQLQRKEKED